MIQLVRWHQIMNNEESGEALKFEATLILQDRVRIGLIADGALWIWKHMAEAYPGGKEILNHYHCSEHVYKLAQIYYPEDQDRQAL